MIYITLYILYNSKKIYLIYIYNIYICITYQCLSNRYIYIYIISTLYIYIYTTLLIQKKQGNIDPCGILSGTYVSYNDLGRSHELHLGCQANLAQEQAFHGDPELQREAKRPRPVLRPHTAPAVVRARESASKKPPVKPFGELLIDDFSLGKAGASKVFRPTLK